MVQKESIAAYIAKHEGMPFVRGYNDCFTFAMRWAGPVLLSQYPYHTATQALAMMRDMGCKKGWQVFDRHFPQIDSPVDGCLIAVDSDESLGGCGIWHDGKSYTISKQGLTYSTAKPIHCWGVE